MTHDKNISLIKKTDDELQILYAEVYIPNVPDSDGEFMTVEEVRKMAHKFIVSGKAKKVDTNHDNELNGSFVVESFIARKDDPDFITDSWVVGIHVPSETVWGQIKNGELNGLSMEAFVAKEESTLEIDIPPVIKGGTDMQYGHKHTFTVKFDDDGNLLGGETDVVDGHRHFIIGGTVTEATNGHRHRFSYWEHVTS